MLTKKIILSLLMAILLSIGSAQEWSPLEMHGGGKVTGIIPHPTNAQILYHRTDVAGINMTTNGGDKWTSITLSLPKYNNHTYKVRSFLLDPRDPNHLVFASGNNGDKSGIWLSEDNGNSWDIKYEDAGFSGNGAYRWADEVMVRKPDQLNSIYVGAQPQVSGGMTSKGGLFFSPDNGYNWSKLSISTFDDLWITKLLFNPQDANEIFIAVADPSLSGIAASSGIWRYNITNGSASQVTSYHTIDVDFDPQDADVGFLIGSAGISKTTNGGATWSTPTKPNNSNYESFVTPHPTEQSHWFFGATNGFYSNGFLETTDDLQTSHFAGYGVVNSVNQQKISYAPYADTNLRPVFGGELANFIFHPADPSKCYADNVYRCNQATGTLVDFNNSDGKTNGNWSWDFIANGIYILVGIGVSPHPIDTDKFRINVADHNQFTTVDGGDDMLFDGLYDHLNYSAVTKFAPSNLSTVYSVGRDHLKNATLNKSSDGGITWSEISSSYLDGGRVIQDIIVDPTNHNKIILGIDNNTRDFGSQLHISTDGGASFTEWDQGITGVKIFKEWQTVRRLLLDDNETTAITFNDSKIYKREIDATPAEPWAEINQDLTNPLRYVAHATNVSGSLYAIYGPNIPNLYWSDDFGATWSTRALPFNSDAGILGVSPQGRVVVTRRGSFTFKREQAVYYIDDVSDNALDWEELEMSGHQSLVKNFTFIGENTLVTNSNGQGSYIHHFDTCNEGFANAWVGPAAGNWTDNAINWSRGEFPTACDNVIIPANKHVTLSGINEVTCRSIEIQTDGNLIVSPLAKISTWK